MYVPCGEPGLGVVVFCIGQYGLWQQRSFGSVTMVQYDGRLGVRAHLENIG